MPTVNDKKKTVLTLINICVLNFKCDAWPFADSIGNFNIEMKPKPKPYLCWIKFFFKWALNIQIRLLLLKLTNARSPIQLQFSTYVNRFESVILILELHISIGSHNSRYIRFFFLVKKSFEINYSNFFLLKSMLNPEFDHSYPIFVSKFWINKHEQQVS